MLLVDKPEWIHLVKFEGIAKKKIQISAIKTHGGTGPSGMDATSRKWILTSKPVGSRSIALCKTFAKIINNIFILPMKAFLACSSIPLHKNSRLRPIEISEALRRIAGKVVLT